MSVLTQCFGILYCYHMTARMYCVQVLDVSGASVLADTLPGCQVDLLDNCGHSVVMERPRKAAHLIMDFITRGSSKKLS